MIRDELIKKLAFEVKEFAVDVDHYQKLKNEADTSMVEKFYEKQVQSARDQKFGFLFALSILGIKEQVVNAALDLEGKK